MGLEKQNEFLHMYEQSWDTSTASTKPAILSQTTEIESWTNDQDDGLGTDIHWALLGKAIMKETPRIFN